jgi:hypothetical protein
MAKIAEILEAPLAVTINIARRRVGKAIKISKKDERKSSLLPRAKPARIPIGAPTKRPIITADKPTTTAIREPSRTRESSSRPKVSVPSQWLQEGGLSRPPLIFARLYGVQRRDIRATAKIAPTIIPPASTLRFLSNAISCSLPLM